MPEKAGEGFLPAAEAVLKRSGKALTCREIVERAINDGSLQSRGATPEKTLSAMLNRNIARLGGRSAFKRADRGLYQLRR